MRFGYLGLSHQLWRIGDESAAVAITGHGEARAAY